jgi:hypothetical protein
MTIPGSANPLLLASAAAAGGYTIERSVRFNSSDSAYLSRTPSTAGNRKTWTWAGWVKRAALGTRQIFFGARVSGSTPYGMLTWTTGNALSYEEFIGGSGIARDTVAVFRDPSAWYHVVFIYDTTQADSLNRIKVYVNGVQQTFNAWSGTPPTQNYDGVVNSTILHVHGINPGYGEGYNGYLADVHFIDGQALDPTSFGEFDDNGIWQPIAYSGTYGTNGFHLPFSDNSTAAALGTDTSGAGNNWTVNNISVAAGAGNDSLVDVPQNGTETDTGVGGEVRGNYSVLNALTGAGTLSNGNLDFSGATGGAQRYGTIGFTTGKWYWEVLVTAGSGSALPLIGIGNNPNQAGLVGIYGYYGFNGNKYQDSTATSYGASYGANDVIGIAADFDAGTITFYKNGTTQGQAYSGLTGTFFPYLRADSGTSVVANFGQRPFAYTAPSGFKALNTANLPAPVVTKPSTVFNALLWTGNNTSGRAITGLDFSPDFVWIKNRTNASENSLFDAVRGAAKTLYSNQTAAELASSAYGHVSSFDANGFTLSNGSDATYPNLATNYLNSAIVGWCWDAGSSTVTNTQGSITSSVRANASAGFSIVTYTGTGATGGTVGHGLGVAPSLIIAKSRDASRGWGVYHKDLTKDKYIELQSTAAAVSTTSVWGSSEPTSTVFGVYNWPTAINNQNGNKYVAYCFAPVSGYSAFGSYTGNGSTDGPFVYTGFRPRWIMVKRSSSTGNWTIKDTSRPGYNVTNLNLFSNLSNAETTEYPVDLLSNGFKVREGTFSDWNASGSTYVWAAFAENPFQYARAR